MHRLKYSWFFILWFLFSCREQSARVQETETTSELSISISQTEKIPVTYFAPAGKIRGEVLVLPGWSYNRKRWLNETRLKEYARKNNFTLVCPEMGKTLYESEFFPETKLKWATVPGRKFISDYLLVQLKQKGIFTGDVPLYILGLSTGARGSVAIAIDHPLKFKAIAALSGDYDQSQMPKDRLMTSVYGSIEEFPERWKNRDNLALNAEKLNTPLYLGHGSQDYIVPVEQSRLMRKILLQK